MVDSSENKYDRLRELVAFDESKAGVKGLVDAGLEKVPAIFNCTKFGLNDNPKTDLSQFSIPVIDFEGIQKSPSRRFEIVQVVRAASERWGFFQVINHGIATNLMDEMIQGVRDFHEMDPQAKRQYYSRDITLKDKKFIYISNFDLYRSPVTQWKDTILFDMGNDNAPIKREELPDVCGDIALAYFKQVKKLGMTIFELIADALGLKPGYFKEMGYAKSMLMLGNYYPQCPEPELAIANTSHTDSDFFSILLQDGIGGLQVLYENHWIDVVPIQGALIVNIGDLLQLISNDALSSANHRVLTKREGPRISLACFFRAEDMMDTTRSYRPIPELISEENPVVYRNITLKEYLDHYFQKGLGGTSTLTPFRL